MIETSNQNLLYVILFHLYLNQDDIFDLDNYFYKIIRQWNKISRELSTKTVYALTVKSLHSFVLPKVVQKLLSCVPTKHVVAIREYIINAEIRKSMTSLKASKKTMWAWQSKIMVWAMLSMKSYMLWLIWVTKYHSWRNSWINSD